MILLPDATLQYRPELSTIVVRWSNESSKSAIIQVYTELLEKAKANECFKWLLDVRRRDSIETDVSTWLNIESLESLLKESVEKATSIAFLVSPTRADIIEEVNWQPCSFECNNNYRCYVKCFLNEQEAYRWLGILN